MRKNPTDAEMIVWEHLRNRNTEFKSVRKKPAQRGAGGKTAGYTLIETIIALSMLMIIAVPVLAGIYRNKHVIDAERIITGIGILEQEACRLAVAPDEFSPVKRRMINGREWTVTTSKQGSPVVLYHCVALFDNKKAGEIYFLQNEK